jgi:hypothetical protein
MQTQFFNVTVEQCACQQTAPDNLVRIIASGQTFFFIATTSATAKICWPGSPPAIG